MTEKIGGSAPAATPSSSKAVPRAHAYPRGDRDRRSSEHSRVLERIDLLPDAEQLELLPEDVLQHAKRSQPNLRGALQDEFDDLRVVADWEDCHAVLTVAFVEDCSAERSMWIRMAAEVD